MNRSPRGFYGTARVILLYCNNDSSNYVFPLESYVVVISPMTTWSIAAVVYGYHYNNTIALSALDRV